MYDYGDNKTLYDEETILVDLQGGMNGLTLWENSVANIQGTSDLVEGSGGIWNIELINNSYLNMSGGEVHEINPHNDATIFLSGGIIQQIRSSQNAWIYAGDPPVLVPNPHITIVYSGDLPTVQEIGGFNYLVGNWGNGTGFSIYLHDVSGYSPTIENIQFELIPEPATLSLLGLGAFLIRRKK